MTYYKALWFQCHRNSPVKSFILSVTFFRSTFPSTVRHKATKLRLEDVVNFWTDIIIQKTLISWQLVQDLLTGIHRTLLRRCFVEKLSERCWAFVLKGKKKLSSEDFFDAYWERQNVNSTPSSPFSKSSVTSYLLNIDFLEEDSFDSWSLSLSSHREIETLFIRKQEL